MNGRRYAKRIGRRVLLGLVLVWLVVVALAVLGVVGR